MKYCPYCGAGLDDDMIFCPKCGKRFAAEKTNPNVSEAPEMVEQSGVHSVPTAMRLEAPSQPVPASPAPKKKKAGRFLAAAIAALAVTLGVLFFTGVLGRGFSENSSAIEDASKSVVMLTCYDQDGELKGSGSGFAVFEEGVIVTNFHVIDHGVFSAKAATEEGGTFNVSVLAYDEDKDIAILRAERATGLSLLPLGKSDDLQKGDKVVAIGSPLGLMNSVSTGVFSGYVNDDGNIVLQFTAPISQGSSGGALFNNKGEVIGVTFASFDNGQNLNLGVPSAEIEKLWTTWKKSEAGDPEAMYEIGEMHLNGYGISEDYAKALALFQKASSLGNHDATVGLGMMYRDGNGVKKDYGKSVKLYKQAADAGNARGMNGLGFMYSYGLGVEKDLIKAFRLFQQAADAGNKDAMRNAGIAYCYGNGVEQDYVKAKNWFEKSAEADNPDALSNIGHMYEMGWGVEQNARKAFEKDMEAYDAGSELAAFYIAHSYESGIGVEPDPSMALEWLQKGADDGVSQCMWGIGLYYENGIGGLAQDYKYAMKWYRKAAERGYEYAMQSIGRMYENGLGVEKNETMAQEWYAKAREADYGGNLTW